MITKLKHFLILIVVSICCSCSIGTNQHALNSTPKQLASEQILELIEDTAFKPYGSNNFHVFYREFLNDSTWVIHIIQNDFLGNDTLGICQVLDFHGQLVFIYGDSCNLQLSEDIKSKNGGPFQYDGASKFLLVENRGGRLEHFTMLRSRRFDVMAEPIDSNVLKVGEINNN